MPNYNQAVASATFTRPGDATPYTSGDLVANSTTAGSVTPMTLSAVRAAGGACILRRLRLRKSSVSITNASFRVHLFSALPTVANGDNAALSMTGVAGYVGYVDVTMDYAFTDGAAGSGTMTSDFNIALTTGAAEIYALLEARAAYTPTASPAEIYTLTAEILQN